MSLGSAKSKTKRSLPRRRPCLRSGLPLCHSLRFVCAICEFLDTIPPPPPHHHQLNCMELCGLNSGITSRNLGIDRYGVPRASKSNPLVIDRFVAVQCKRRRRRPLKGPTEGFQGDFLQLTKCLPDRHTVCAPLFRTGKHRALLPRFQDIQYRQERTRPSVM